MFTPLTLFLIQGETCDIKRLVTQYNISESKANDNIDQY